MIGYLVVMWYLRSYRQYKASSGNTCYPPVYCSASLRMTCRKQDNACTRTRGESIGVNQEVNKHTHSDTLTDIVRIQIHVVVVPINFIGILDAAEPPEK